MNLLTSLRAFHVESTYATFRAENRHPLIVALNFWRYLLKYLLAKKRYPKGVIDWAERALAHRAEAPPSPWSHVEDRARRGSDVGADTGRGTPRSGAQAADGRMRLLDCQPRDADRA
jgi:hypothetical protein